MEGAAAGQLNSPPRDGEAAFPSVTQTGQWGLQFLQLQPPEEGKGPWLTSCWVTKCLVILGVRKGLGGWQGWGSGTESRGRRWGREDGVEGRRLGRAQRPDARPDLTAAPWTNHCPSLGLSFLFWKMAGQ